MSRFSPALQLCICLIICITSQSSAQASLLIVSSLDPLCTNCQLQQNDWKPGPNVLATTAVFFSDAPRVVGRRRTVVVVALMGTLMLRQTALPSRECLLRVLNQRFGLSAFRENKESAIVAALSGQDVFISLPTGGGKSLCYSLPAAMEGGTVLVVSPLIALMQDQVEALRLRNIPCEFLASCKSEAERQAVLQGLQSEQPVALLFATPELIATQSFREVLHRMYAAGRLQLCAVDEAHCISSWGHDFRPAYRKLSVIRTDFPSLPIMALTATAAAKVREDIIASLRLRSPKVLLSSFDRANIFYSVHFLLTGSDAVDELTKLLAASKGSSAQMPCTIIYALKRDTVDQVARHLSRQGIACQAYHAGRPASERERVLAQWSSGAVPCVSATIAFGMGIDKPDVRTVVHLNLPKTLEGFYQESGRAGRDGQPSHSLLFYSRADRDRMDFILGKEAGRSKKRQRNDSSATRLHPQQAFGKVVNYCTARACRRALLLAHFGERLPAGSCSGCAYCKDPAGVETQAHAPLLKLEEDFRRQLPGSRQSRLPTGPAGDKGSDADTSSDPGSGVAADSDDGQLFTAERAARQARRAGGTQDDVVDALVAAEQRQAAQAEGRLKQLGRLHSRSAAKAVPKVEGKAAISEALRSTATEQLLKALLANAALQSCEPQQLSAASQAMELACHTGAASKSVYLSMLANTCRAACQLQALPSNELPKKPAVHPPKQPDATMAHLPGSATALWDSLVPHLQALEAESPHQCHEQGVTEILQQMCRTSTNRHELAAGLGKKLKALAKHKNDAVSKAAQAVVAAYKEQIKHTDPSTST